MKIYNTTNKSLLAEDAFEATSWKDRSLGLLDSSKPRSLVFSTRFGVHTFGMKEKIDIVILNDVGKIVKLKHSLHPQQLFWWNPKYSRVIELPAGTLQKSKTQLGDHLALSS